MNEFLFSVPFSGSRSNPVDPNSDLSSYRSSRDSLAYSKYPRIQVEACGHLVYLSWHGLVLGMAIFPYHTQAEWLLLYVQEKEYSAHMFTSLLNVQQTQTTW